MEASNREADVEDREADAEDGDFLGDVEVSGYTGFRGCCLFRMSIRVVSQWLFIHSPLKMRRWHKKMRTKLPEQSPTCERRTSSLGLLGAQARLVSLLKFETHIVLCLFRLSWF